MEAINRCLANLDEREQKRYRFEFAKLDENQQQQLDELVARMENAGATKPLSWAWSEFSEGIPQWARFMILKGIYQSANDVEGNADAALEFNQDAGEIFEEISKAVGEKKLKQFLTAYSKGMLYNMIGIFDEGNPDYDSKDSWLLVTQDRESDIIARPISGLHEDFLEFDREYTSE
ncbi:hypothetical protein BBH99_08825 [Chryseobacterium contaminans]|uniref:Uncharacterized protein n=1 Tax=Chryseobacterium contaminans TaxID=1423959 RepID=A0A1M6YGB9_9FLAO|nr:hypothetical protein [Chryseobacterium contaminans]OCA78317.1 hypothetical protein BBH99_08825 [Chryseobacterium contaminans]SHL17326.1 hypothetical protein SAMN05444407_102507 [Chryseobacterium contaminans]